MIDYYQKLGYDLTSKRRDVDTTRIAYDSSGRIEYQGWADAGTAETIAKWSIKKFVYDPKTGSLKQTLWADGDINFDNVWSSREALTYA